jgi:hypothetical protein
MLGEKAEAPMDGWEGISEGGREKSTANRFGLLSSRQGLIEIVEGGDAGPTDATPGNQINKGLCETRTTNAYVMNLNSMLSIQTRHTVKIQYEKMYYVVPSPKREYQLGRRSAMENRSSMGRWSECLIALAVEDGRSCPMTRGVKRQQVKFLPML